MLSSPSRLRHGVIAALVSALLLVAPGCSSKSKQTSSAPSASSSEDKVRFAKTKFVANASLASGAVYQWIYKPHKAGTFKSGAKGRTAALVKGGLAAAFAYNRFKAAIHDAKGDPLLSKAVAPLTGSVDKLKELGSKIKSGNASDADFNQIQSTVNDVKNAGSHNGANVTDKVPSQKELTGGS